jgi:glycosyltransferase involved in cell wall biosynthesis
MIRALVYGDVDLNLIDGSAVWLASLTELLAESGRAEVTVLRKTRSTRNTLTGAIEQHQAVELIDPWQVATENRRVAQLLDFNAGGRVHPATAAALIRSLDEREFYDVILVRGPETAAILGGSPEIAERLWVYVVDPLRLRRAGEIVALRRLFGQAQRFLCQTEEAREALARQIGADPERLSLLPPMVPALATSKRVLDGDAPPRLGYSGKFSPPYQMIEMLDAFEAIRERRPTAEFHVVGDKFHNAPHRPGFEEEVTARLRSTPGVVWHGGLDRDAAAAVIGSVHVAASWRDSSFDDSVEISTKVLEYASLGIPMLLNPTAIQRRLLGDSYAGFVDSKETFVERFLDLTASPKRYDRLSRVVRKAAAPFTFAVTSERLLPLLEQDATRSEPKRRLRILFAGHDFKFVQPLIEHYERHPDYRVLRDEYRGHVITDERRSLKLLRSAEVVFCEWSLGNAEWYSQNKREGQTLIVRLHHQELELDVLDRIDWNAVDAICFICEQNRQTFLAERKNLAPKAKLIYNLVDVTSFDREKVSDAHFTLGLMGTAPRRKAPHLALEILKRLREVDSRYQLRIKGKQPREYDWLWRRPEERSYYERFDELLAEPELAGAVMFDDHGHDVPAWFSQIGFVLSTSEHEGSHQSVAEGMASGAVPVIRNWPGANDLYPARHVFSSVEQAVKLIQKCSDPVARATEGQACRAFAAKHFDQTRIAADYDRLIMRLRSAPYEELAA